MSWMDVANLALAFGLVGFVSFDIGIIVGRRRQRADARDRQSSMLHHPTNHLRVAREK
jgi:hypothetical protein